jgi:hypothetical protein
MANGFTTNQLDSETELLCEKAYSSFIRDHKLHGWKLHILGLQTPELSMRSTFPDGRMGSTQSVVLTLDVASDVLANLEADFKEWQKSAATQI